MDEHPRDTTASPAPGASQAGDFERYALVAALTLVVLCLLVWDRWHEPPPVPTAPPEDAALAVEIGGREPGKSPPLPRAAAVERRTDVTPTPRQDPAPAPPAERTYTVQEGDSLGDIAKHELGSSSRWSEIAKLNGLADSARLRIGQVLKLPAR